ncbi:MAG: GWxTD domain-containing protein, partial [Bacteroidota bacterium]
MSDEPMLARYFAPLAFFLALLLVMPARAQVAYKPAFSSEVVVARDDDGTSRLDVYADVPYQNLRFLARTGGFEASYVVTAEVQRVAPDGTIAGLVASRTWSRDVTVASYDETLGEDSDRSVQAIAIEPGRYVLEVTLEDGASGRTFAHELGAIVRDMSGPIAMGDPVFLNAYDPASGLFEPNIGGAVSTEQEAFTVYYELFTGEAANLRVTYAVTDRARLGDRPSFSALLGLAPRQREDVGVPVLVTEALAVPAGGAPAAFRVPTEDLQVGEYTLTIRLETADGDLISESERPFAVEWDGLDAQIADLDAAIAQLRYVAKDREVDAIRSAPTHEDRVRLFREFWSRRDPTPGTERNEQMEAYYYRVAYANDRYGQLRGAGWNTDRGEVFIRFGEPDHVEDRPFSYGANKPYQVWYYYRHGRQFIFLDEGVGDYELLIPIW